MQKTLKLSGDLGGLRAECLPLSQCVTRLFALASGELLQELALQLQARLPYPQEWTQIGLAAGARVGVCS